MGIPVLHGVAGESASIVRKEKVGMVFEPENSEELVSKLIGLKNDYELYAQLKANCLQGAGNYDRAVLAKSMMRVLQSVV